MRSHTRPSFLALVLALGLTISACDAVNAPGAASADAVTLDTQAALSGDVLYDLAPLTLGETFDVTVDAGADDLRLRSTRTRAGYDLAFVPGGLRPDSVIVTYLLHGREVAEPITFTGNQPVSAGAAEEGPDSWHYVWRDGAWIVAKDYSQDLTGEGTTRFTTVTGDIVTVSDVAFTVYGLDAPPPSNVRFESPEPIAITAEAFGRPLR